MFSHPRSLGLLALSATLLAQPGGWSRAAGANDPPLIKPVPRASILEDPVLAGARWTTSNWEDIKVNIHARPFFKPDNGVIYPRLADDTRSGTGASLNGQIRPSHQARAPLKDMDVITAPNADALRFADYALSPEVAGLITFVYGTSLSTNRGDEQEAACVPEVIQIAPPAPITPASQTDPINRMIPEG